ncbi:MAG TPA: ATP-grasp domain-containing protein [Candidatus Tectomicrobia bacterium]|nr:ATP-grasp domain-containing protein [Candidatus Tectomicrobia bacterium]
MAEGERVSPPCLRHLHRLLLLMTTTTYRAQAFLEAARRLDIPVVIGSERQQALAAANPAGHLTLDFAAPEEATHTILEFAQTFPIDGIVAADDDGVLLAAQASAALGLAHNPVAGVETARDKARMRQAMAHAGMRSPRFWRFAIDDDPAAMALRVEYPCVVKPRSLSASRGVIRADDPTQFVAAFQRLLAILRQPDVAISPRRSAREILVERFIPGLEVALEGLLTEGKLHVLAIFDKPDPLDGPFFEETIYVTPSRLSSAVQEEIASCTAEVASTLGLRHGPIHAELRVNEHGSWLLEIAPRSIGGLCSRTLRFGDGLSLEELLLCHALGMQVEALERERRAAGVMMIPIPRQGILRQIAGQEDAKQVAGIEDIRITIPIGQAVVPLPEGSRYLGFIFARDETPVGVEAALREAHRRLTFTITPADEPGRAREPPWPVASGADILPLLGQ